MEVRAERLASAVILYLEGRMNAETGSDWLRQAVVAATGDGARHAVVDMGGVVQMDCAGIGQLLDLRAFVHGARRTFALASVERHQKRMLGLSGLLHVFRVFEDSQAAVIALGLGESRDVPRAELAARELTVAHWRPVPGLRAAGCMP
jgi:anti-anti-sigma factor